MYIAFKWLLGLGIAMWLATCCIDLVKTSDEIYSTGFNVKITRKRYNEQKKFNVIRHDIKTFNDLTQGFAIIHIAMFTAGALAVSISSRRREIILFIKHNFPKLDVYQIRQQFILITKQKTKVYLIKAVEKINVATSTVIRKLWEIIKNFILKLITEVSEKKCKSKQANISLVLLKKLKEVEDQRHNMKQLLLIVLEQNKNLKNQCHLEMMAKERLQRYMEEIQKLIKENRTRYFGFQYLYLTTRQENSFLNVRVRQLTKEKVDAERRLMKLVNKVYESKNTALFAYCTDFIVPTKETSFRSSNSKMDNNDQTHKLVSSTSGITTRSCSTTALDNTKKNCFPNIVNEEKIKINSFSPKLKGLPGEFVWAVQNKDGFIQKIYEYGYSCNFKNRDTMRRIREYSVYFDKDSLLDYKSTETNTKQRSPMTMKNQDYKTYNLASQKFLSGSKEFQRFLHDNTNIVSKPDVDTSPVLCG